MTIDLLWYYIYNTYNAVDKGFSDSPDSEIELSFFGFDLGLDLDFGIRLIKFHWPFQNEYLSICL